VLADHEKRLSLSEQQRAAILERDAECRAQQHESWQRSEARMTALEKAVVEIGNRQTSNEGGKARSAQVWVAVIAAIAMVVATCITAIAGSHAAAAAAAATAAVKALGAH